MEIYQDPEFDVSDFEGEPLEEPDETEEYHPPAILEPSKTVYARPYVDPEGYVCYVHHARTRRLYQWNTNKEDSRTKHLPWPGERPPGGYVCWNDTYAFEGTPFGIVKHYDAKRDKWFMRQPTFCSANCSCSFAKTDECRSYFHPISMMHTRTYMHKVMGIRRDSRILAAPPRYWLERFQPGVGISIESYRSDFTTTQTTVLSGNMISEVTLVEEIEFKRREKANMAKATTTTTNSRGQSSKSKGPVCVKSRKRTLRARPNTLLMRMLQKKEK